MERISMSIHWVNLLQKLDMYSKIHLTRLREQGTMCMKRSRMVWKTSVYL